ncbi:Hypothetical protein NTJ_11865 [Nesidiocoris tenuis]|uniref:CRAL-TRIO domain-containing protein n=1 Tax=Nesidiocoris tenuis TaxID=355587 RepID=A0ABN7B8E4_9HEMI|nr:Hypothetical protein NTJ_11865 [Nesidiocoris tenuis]
MNAIVTTTNPKIKSRITVTSLPLEKVFDDVEMLPSEYEGGQEKSIRSFCDSTITKYLEDLKDVIPNLDDTVDEAKRLNVDRDVFSIQGTFKSLVID